MSVWVMAWAYCLSMPPQPCFVEQDVKGKSYQSERECNEAAKVYAARPMCIEIKLIVRGKYEKRNNRRRR